jgi:nitrogen fixation protein FixH
MTRKFTGWHMATIMVAFFAVVVGVNITMARFAIGTFGGTVVENSYVASQQYNGWLAKARQQAALGWSPDVSTDASRHVVISIKTATGPLDGARISATATHPLGALPPVSLTFAQGATGARSLQSLPAGRWLLHIDVAHASAKAAFDNEIGS